MGEKIRVAKVMVHNWEEPCISGTRGSGAIFFSGCNLKCVYCQNRVSSHEKHGYEMTVSELASKMLELQDMGVHNINLVTPTHYSDKIRDAIDLTKDKLHIPIVYNTSGYELDTEIQKMAGYVDVFLTDMKYFSHEAAQKYSRAGDYFPLALSSLEAMLRIAPECELDENGILNVVVKRTMNNLSEFHASGRTRMPIYFMLVVEWQDAKSACVVFEP